MYLWLVTTHLPHFHELLDLINLCIDTVAGSELSSSYGTKIRGIDVVEAKRRLGALRQGFEGGDCGLAEYFWKGEGGLSTAEDEDV